MATRSRGASFTAVPPNPSPSLSRPSSAVSPGLVHPDDLPFAQEPPLDSLSPPFQPPNRSSFRDSVVAARTSTHVDRLLPPPMRPSKGYCCFAIPLYNAGIYAILGQFGVISMVTGVLAVGAPDIIAISLPAFYPWIFGTLCILAGLLQTAGWYGVFKEKGALFRKYTLVNAALVGLCFLLALLGMIVSGARHATAVERCTNMFGNGSKPDDAIVDAHETETGNSICETWLWVQLGVMITLWVLLAGSETYFVVSTRMYSVEQLASHAAYDTVVKEERHSIAIRHSMAWDPELNAPRLPGHHQRQASSLRNEVFVEGDERSLALTPVESRASRGAGSPSPLRPGTAGSFASAAGASSLRASGMSQLGRGHAPQPSTSTSVSPFDSPGSQAMGLPSPQRGRANSAGSWHAPSPLSQGAALQSSAHESEALYTPTTEQRMPLRQGSHPLEDQGDDDEEYEHVDLAADPRRSVDYDGGGRGLHAR